MLDRWEKRWQNNVSRYEDLSCVKVILPWSTPQMRFCTSYGDLSSVNNHSGPVIHGNPKASMLQSHCEPSTTFNQRHPMAPFVDINQQQSLTLAGTNPPLGDGSCI
jgi:hypothetical protein